RFGAVTLAGKTYRVAGHLIEYSENGAPNERRYRSAKNAADKAASLRPFHPVRAVGTGGGFCRSRLSRKRPRLPGRAT
ncbi:MAG TPA: hypothetical protein VHJ56_09730, partial [Candidatus Binatia bacterium]|nr:hypothetical protein [Candidatus Binatia bacterium]